MKSKSQFRVKIPTKSDLEKELWRVFSLYVRQRDADENGIITCISCGKRVHWRNCDAGHYYSRNKIYLAVKYDETNVNAQCKHCNGFLQGNAQGYREGLIKKYGHQALEILDIKKHNICHWDKFVYQALIEEYKNKLKENGWE